MKDLNNLRIKITEKYVYLMADCPEPYKSIWFLWPNEDWNDFCASRREMYTDAGHQCYDIGEACMFFDLTFPRKPSGEFTTKYQTVNIPHFVRKILHTYVNKIRQKLEKDGDFYLEIDKARLERWCRLYGQGKGEVKVVLSFSEDKLFPEEKAKFESRLKDESFQNSIEHLKAIAGNRTYTFFNKQEVKLSYDWAGYIFSAGGMYGGLINHGTEDKPDWSLHT